MDVARFKYPPYWVTVNDLFESMNGVDKSTGKGRGWFKICRESEFGDGGKVEKGKQREIGNLEDLENVKGTTNVVSGGRCPINDTKKKFCKIGGGRHNISNPGANGVN